MVYIAGEASKCGRLGVCCRWRSFCQEMSRYTMELIMDKWVKPSVDISKWEFYDLSCKDPMDFPCGFYGGGTASGRLFLFSACFELQERDATNDQVLKDGS